MYTSDFEGKTAKRYCDSGWTSGCLHIFHPRWIQVCGQKTSSRHSHDNWERYKFGIVFKHVSMCFKCSCQSCKTPIFEMYLKHQQWLRALLLASKEQICSKRLSGRGSLHAQGLTTAGRRSLEAGISMVCGYAPGRVSHHFFFMQFFQVLIIPLSPLLKHGDVRIPHRCLDTGASNKGS